MRLVDKAKDRKLIKLYKRGASFAVIANALGNKSRASVYERFKRLVKEKKLSTVRA